MLLSCLRQHVFPLLCRLYYCLFKVGNFYMGEIPSGMSFTLGFAKTSHFIQTLSGGTQDVHNIDITYFQLGSKKVNYKLLCF